MSVWLPFGQIARTLEALDFVVGTLLMLFWRMFRHPDAYSDNSEEHEQLKARGRAAVIAGLDVVDQSLAGKDWLVGDFGIADAALYYVEHWAGSFAGWTLPPNVAAHFERMKKRPSAQANIALEASL